MRTRMQALFIAIVGAAFVLCHVCLSYGEAHSPEKRYYTVVVRTFNQQDTATKFFDRFTQRILSELSEGERYYLRVDRINDKFSVRVGRFEEKANASNLLEKIRPHYPDALVLLSHFDDSVHMRLYGREFSTSNVESPGKIPQSALAGPTSGQQTTPRPEPYTPMPQKPATKKTQESPKGIPAGHHTVIDKGLVKGVIGSIDPISSTLLGVSPERNLYRVVVKVIDAEDVSGYPNILRERIGQDVTCFSDTALPRELVGTRIRGLVEYKGDERSRLFWISAVEQLGGPSVPQ